MPSFSDTSDRRLDTCHPDIQKLFREVIKDDDCSVLEGHRNRTRQNRLFNTGKSKVMWPDSGHNSMPSEAVDAAPYVKGKGVVWDLRQCSYFAGKVMAKARQMGIRLRWGGDWDGDGDVNDQTFNDLVHFELIND